MSKWKSIIGLMPIKHRAYRCARGKHCAGDRRHLQNYCRGLALASAVGALSGTIPWSWALLTHALTIAVYWLFAISRPCQRCIDDDLDGIEAE